MNPGSDEDKFHPGLPSRKVVIALHLSLGFYYIWNAMQNQEVGGNWRPLGGDYGTKASLSKRSDVFGGT